MKRCGTLCSQMIGVLAVVVMAACSSGGGAVAGKPAPTKATNTAGRSLCDRVCDVQVGARYRGRKDDCRLDCALEFEEPEGRRICFARCTHRWSTSRGRVSKCRDQCTSMLTKRPTLAPVLQCNAMTDDAAAKKCLDALARDALVAVHQEAQTSVARAHLEMIYKGAAS